MKNKGKIIPNGVSLEKHEYDTILFLTTLGYDIELIPPTNTPKSKTPDFIMKGKAWEMKSPQGKSKTTIEHTFKKAVKQSENIVIDLVRTKMGERNAIKEAKRCFLQTKSCRRMIILTKRHKCLEFQK